MKLLLAQLNPLVGDLKGNLQKVLKALEEGRNKGANLVIFPEMVLSGYPPEDLLMSASFIQEIEKSLIQITQASLGLACVIGLPRWNPHKKEKRLFNSAAIFENGKFLGFQDKQLLPTYDVFSEKRYFEPGTSSNLFFLCGKRVGITICEDLWQQSGLLSEVDYFQDPVDELKQASLDLLLNLSASPYCFERSKERLFVCQKAAKTLKCPVVLCNQVGGNDGLIFDGKSVVISKEGELIAEAKAFQEDLCFVQIPPLKKGHFSKQDPLEELYQALVLGLKDYVFKLGFKQVVFGLSGGIDSAVVACLAKEALGSDRVLCLCMPSRFSSEGSLKDADLLTKRLGLKKKIISIEKPFEAYLDLLNPLFSEEMLGVTQENLQARIRGMILMAFSNQFGHLVLSCGNKSELAMGYCTLYGDLCGGISLLGDLTKTQVYALAKWINRKEEIIPEAILTKAPSAELRPNQKDSDSLPDYRLIDAVIIGSLEEHLSEEQIAQKYQISLSLVKDLVKKILKNEYKRRQAPFSLRVSKKAFSTGRCFPIVQKI